MKTTKKIILSLLLCVLSSGYMHAQKAASHNFELAKNLEIFNDVYRQLDLFYVDSLSADTVMQWGINAMLSKVDPFTVYYPATDNDELKEMTTGKFAGVGSVIRYYKKEDRVMLIEPWEDSPATEAGVKAGDVIMSIDGKDVKGMSTAAVSRLLRGDAGSTFRLVVKREGVEDSIVMKVTRRNLDIPPIPYYNMVSDSVGYIFLDRFVDGCAREVRRAIIDLKERGAKALVLDLRGNPGGPLNEAVEVVNLFVPRGQKVVYTKGKLASVNSEYFTKKEPLDAEIPLAVLVDGGSASSSEIVSGSLQDLDRAVIIGTRTYGKGLVQMIRQAPYGGNVKITTSRYYIPSGRCIQAYDYRHLTDDGRATTLPDSLTKEFTTRAGRKVRDGGGIKPDVIIEPDSLPTLVFDVLTSDVALEYITHYVATHKTIAAPAEFRLGDEDYKQFVAMVKKSGFTYKKRTDEMMRLLEVAARLEGCYDGVKADIELLKQKMKGDVEVDLMRFRKEISRPLEQDIAARYYYRKGAVQNQLRDDKELHKAREILGDEAQYKKILSAE